METIVIDRTNREAAAALLEQLFRARHSIFAVARRWVPVSPDGLERDQFDTDEATYIVFLEAGRIIAGSRLIETQHPHLASEIFPDLFTRLPLPRDPLVVEWTRGFIVPERRSVALMAYCCTEIMQHCLDRGYRQLGGLQELRWLKLWARLGWRTERYGEPVAFDGEPWLPAYCDVTEASLTMSRRKLLAL